MLDSSNIRLHSIRMHDVLIVSHSQAKETEAGVDGVDDDAVYWGW